jgi:hypothetical protein
MWKDGAGMSLWKEAVKARNVLNVKIVKMVRNKIRNESAPLNLYLYSRVANFEHETILQ